MKNWVATRHLPQNESYVASEFGVRDGDEFQIEVFQGKKQKLKLNRHKMEFQLGKEFVFETLLGNITLPKFSNQKGSFILQLVDEKGKNQTGSARYLLRALEDEPFRLNGVYAFEAFIERGDIVEIGYNKIHFLRQIETMAETNLLPVNIMKSLIPICIEGETGSGKTTLAKEIHQKSGRVGAFVHLNLSSFSSSLIESELFGHVRGAFTGALNDKKGAIASAHNGTLFLDEIDSLSLDLQTKLLLFLDSYEYRPVGGENTHKANLRLIIASGSNLQKLVATEKMRKDFLFRITSGVVIRLKSLREESEKIRAHCYQFEEKYGVTIDHKLIDYYSSCPWPGNYRQLKAHLEKKRAYSNGKRLVLDFEDEALMKQIFSSESFEENLISLEKVKVEYCHRAFVRMDKNLTRTAVVLGVSLNTLRGYLNKKEN